MINENIKEGRHYIVYSRSSGNTVTAHFEKWDDVEEFVYKDKSAYKIISIDVFNMPLMGIRERWEHKNDR